MRRMSSIVSRLGLSMLTTTTSGSSSRTRRDEILRAFQPGEQAIAGSRQARFHDFGASRVVVDQQDGERLGHGGCSLQRLAATTMPPIQALFPQAFRLPSGLDWTLPSARVTWP